MHTSLWETRSQLHPDMGVKTAGSKISKTPKKCEEGHACNVFVRPQGYTQWALVR